MSRPPVTQPAHGTMLHSMGTAWRDRITTDPSILVGKPVVRGARLAVEFVLDLLATGWSFDDVLANYPGLTIEDVRACIAYAKDVLSEERVFPATSA